MTDLFGRYFKITFTAVIFLELLSLLGFLYPTINISVFFLLLTITLAASLKKLEYGILLLFAELFVGSKGYLFSFSMEGFTVSIRIAMFFTVLGVWLLRCVEKRDTRILHSKFAMPFFLIFIALAWGAGSGFFRNDFQNMFFDANGWIFFVLIFPVFDVVTSTKEIEHLLETLAGSMMALALKTFFLLYVFSHQMYDLMYAIYRWVRDTGVGEITAFTPFFSRIFIQSHLYALPLFFLAAGFIFFRLKKSEGERQTFFTRLKDIRNTKLAVIFIAMASIIIVSFSRSFWAGGFFGLLVFLSLLVFKLRNSLTFIARSSTTFPLLLLMSFGLVYGIGNFPYPKIDEGFNASLLRNRLASFSNEAAAVSRWNLLPSLWNEIKKTPFFGAGFGATVTYVSKDPRVLVFHPSGEFTTFAFEWGYLDIWLKLGLAGLFVYGLLLTRIWKSGFLLLKTISNNEERYMILGLLSSLVALAGTHFWSPYLNHPLGIGFIIFLAAVFEVLHQEKHMPILPA